MPIAPFALLGGFLRLEGYRLRTGMSWYEAKAAILREAIRAYLAQPIYELIPTARVLQDVSLAQECPNANAMHARSLQAWPLSRGRSR